MYGKCECFVIQRLYVSFLYVSCGILQCYVLHDLQFVYDGQGSKKRPYDGREILQSRSHDCLIGSHEFLKAVMRPSFCLPHAVAFIICRGLCACTEML